MTSLSKYWTSMALVLGGALLPMAAGAQQTGTVTGTVVEKGTGRPIPDAMVVVAGTPVGSRTAENGTYRITGVASGPVVIRVARLGYGAASQPVNVGAGGSQTVNFTLAPAATQLDAVVTSAVTGQVERAREVGTNVGTIAVGNIEKGPITRMADILTARTAGVTVQQTAGTSGTGQRIRVRGANSLSLSDEPLVFVDGTNVTNSSGLSFGVGGQAVSRLNDISPDDIEKVEILKGPAATAIYGTAAANGVLLITTKRGRAGKPRWNLYTEGSRQKDITDYPANYLRYKLNTPGAPVYLSSGAFNSAARTACFNYNRAAGTCTGDSAAVFNTLLDSRTSPFVEGNLSKTGASIAGGNTVTQYYVDGETNSEHGIVEYNTVNRQNFRANLNSTIARGLDFQLSTQYTRSKLALNSNDNSVFSPLINGLVGSAFFTPADSLGIQAS
jgi:TonB-dependent SusC/RagA subfamily outer membrane receptor